MNTELVGMPPLLCYACACRPVGSGARVEWPMRETRSLDSDTIE